jgi:bifunctional polynucleotide phosphatase/kinase
VFDVPLDLAQHLNYYRERLTRGAHKHVPRIAYNTYKKNFELPTADEGWDAVISVPFVPKFENDEQVRLFQMKH